jgi:hypothetical protein
MIDMKSDPIPQLSKAIVKAFFFLKVRMLPSATKAKEKMNNIAILISSDTLGITRNPKYKRPRKIRTAAITPSMFFPTTLSNDGDGLWGVCPSGG